MKKLVIVTMIAALMVFSPLKSFAQSQNRLDIGNLLYQLQKLSERIQEAFNNPNGDDDVKADGIIKGYVVEDTEMLTLWSPIPNANVVCKPAHGGVLKTETDAEGFFQFEGVTAGSAVVEAFKDGFTANRIEVNVEEGITSEITIRLKTSEPAIKGLKGTVFAYDLNGKVSPAPDVKVSISVTMDEDPINQTVTDENGIYQFEDISTGHYFVSASAQDYQDALAAVFISEGRLISLNLFIFPENPVGTSALFGKTVEKIDNWGILNRFLSVPDVTVTLLSATDNTIIRSGMTDAEGKFRFFKIPTGEYILKAEHEKFEYYQQTVKIVEAVDDSVKDETISVRFDNDADNGAYLLQGLKDFFDQFSTDAFYIDQSEGVYHGINFIRVVLSRKVVEDEKAAISGHVYSEQDGEKKPVANAAVSVTPFFPYPTFAPLPVYTTKTDEAGHYNIADLPVGTYDLYEVMVEADGYKPWTGRVKVTAGIETVQDVVLITPPPTAHLEGHVYDGSVRCNGDTRCIVPIPQAKIILTPVTDPTISYSHGFYTVTDSDGFYEFNDIPTGKYMMTVSAEGYQTWEQDIPDIEAGENVFNVNLMPILRCTENTNCSEDQYCAKPFGQCDGEGICNPKPEAWPEYYSPVCGCDGKTYGNEHEAAGYGVNVAYKGMCNPDQVDASLSGHVYDGSVKCTDDTKCIAPIAKAHIKLFRLSPDSSYPPHTLYAVTDESGYYEIPDVVDGPSDYSIIVGAEGYQVVEEAITILPGENVYDVKLMPISTCRDNSECSDNQYCAKGVGACEGEGVCAPKPEYCYFLYSPVCGCDEKTYSNECVAAAAGVNIAYKGECNAAGEKASLAGNVRNGITDCADGTDCIVPLIGAVIELFPIHPVTNDGVYYAKTDEQGYYEFQSLNAGEYNIQVHAEKYQPFADILKIVPGENFRDIELMPILDDPIPLPVYKDASISGRISRGASNCTGSNCNAPVSGARIELYPQNTSIPKTLFHAVTDADGYYKIPQLIVVGNKTSYQMVIIINGKHVFSEIIDISPGENVRDVSL